MINRRSTPSGDGRGRGRTGGSGRSGRPAFRSDDSRGGNRRDNDSRGGYRGDSDSRGGYRGESDSRGTSRGDNGFRGGSRGGDDNRGGSRRDDFRDRPARDSLRADRGGSRARYGDGDRPSRFQREERSPGGDREARFGGDRRESRPAGGDRGASRFGGGDRGTSRFGGGDRGTSRFGGGDSRTGGGDRGTSRFSGGDRRDSRFGGGDDRREGRYGRDERPRDGDRGGYRPEGRDDRFGDSRGDRRDGGRGDFRAERRDGGRGDFRGDRPDSAYDGARDGGRDRGHDGGRDERGAGFRAGRSGRREDTAPSGTNSTRSRYGRRDGDDRGGRPGGDARGAGYSGAGYGGAGRGADRRGGDGRSGNGRSGDGRGARTSRRDEVQTLGGGGGRDGYRGSQRGRDGFAGSGRGREGFGGPGRGRDGSEGSSRGRDGSGSPQRDRVKAARQPLRDYDFYPEGYTDERDTTEVPGGVRLQKVLAQAGVASRRACEEMIGEGRVTVNGQVVRRFGAKVDPAAQVIHVDGKRIPTAPDLVYYALNKPIGVVSTMDDPQGRPCLADFVEELAPRLFHVGRLDTETEGLLLLTNDGELANRLTHPSYGVQKKYWAKVPGPIPRDLARRLKQGIELEDGLARADSFAVVHEHGQQALVEVVLHEGRKHVVRRMLEEAGHRVIDLARIEFGPVKLGRTKPGTVRSLSLKEVGELYAAVKL
ncbi:pseudouridine synthase [Nonomuraea sp. NPDC048882]|uniref:pseudouridine synthase n=1 Tax=Nonomuraea sp. NPDC048882 TaxID=3154347 RepID=UPI0033D3D408